VWASSRTAAIWASLFPPTCLGCGRLVRHDRALALCSRCQPRQARLPDSLASRDQVWAPWSYDGPLADAVVALKFGGNLALAGPLGRLLAAEERLRFDAQGRAHELVVAIPLHWRRRVARGFDQAEALARSALTHAAAEHGSAPPLGRRVLRRTRATAQQTELDAAARQRNVEDAFEVVDPERVRDLRVLVIDDVTTTGATFQACAAALRRAGAASLEGLALVRAV
jgi:ComF family protein